MKYEEKESRSKGHGRSVLVSHNFQVAVSNTHFRKLQKRGVIQKKLFADPSPVL